MFKWNYEFSGIQSCAPFKEKNSAIKVKCVWDCFVKLWWLSDFNDHYDAFCNYEKIQYFIDENHC